MHGEVSVMNPGWKNAARLVLTVGAVSVLAGCTVKSTKLFEGSRAKESVNWRSGDELYIESANGSVVVDVGSDDEVSAEVTPFVLLDHDATDEEARDELEKLELTVSAQDESTAPSGTRIVVNLERIGTVKSSLGGDLDVEIPAEFDGALRVEQENGSTEIRDTGNASIIRVRNDNGSCEVNLGSPSDVEVSCDNGQLEGRVAGIPDDFEGGTFLTGNGDIELVLPTDGAYRVVAESKGGGIVDQGNAQSAGCAVQEESDSSKTISCGGATADSPSYRVVADGGMAHEITLAFR